MSRVYFFDEIDLVYFSHFAAYFCLFVVIVSLHAKICCISRKLNKTRIIVQMQSSVQSVSNTTCTQRTGNQSMSYSNKRSKSTLSISSRVLVTVSVLLGLLFITWLPPVIIFIITAVDPDIWHTQFNYYIIQGVWYLYFANSLFDSIVYMIRLPEVLLDTQQLQFNDTDTFQSI